MAGCYWVLLLLVMRVWRCWSSSWILQIFDINLVICLKGFVVLFVVCDAYQESREVFFEL